MLCWGDGNRRSLFCFHVAKGVDSANSRSGAAGVELAPSPW